MADEMKDLEFLDAILAAQQQGQPAPAQVVPDSPNAPDPKVRAAIDEAAMFEFLNSITGGEQQKTAPATTTGGTSMPASFQGGFRIPSPQEAQQLQQRAEESLTKEAMAQGAADIAAGVTRGLAPVAAGALVGTAIGGLPLAAAGAATVGLAKVAGDPLTIGINALFGTNFATPSEGFEVILDKIGVARPQSEVGKLAQHISTAVADTSAQLGLGTVLAESAASSPIVKRIGAFLAEKPTEQLAGAVGGALGVETAGGVAQALGAEDGGRLAAEIAGGLFGSVAASRLSALEMKPTPNLTRVPGMTSEQVAKTIKAAEEAGIDVLTTDVFRPQGRIEQMLYNVVEGATGGKMQKQVQQSQEKIAELMKQFGYAEGVDYAPALSESLLQERASRLAARKGELTRLFERLDASGKRADASNAVEVIDSAIKQLKDDNLATNAPLILTLEKVRVGLFDKTASALDRNLKQVGTMLDDPGLGSIKDAAGKIKQSIYSALKKDIGMMIKDEAGRKGYKTWVAANADLSDMAKERTIASFRTTLNKGDVNPSVIDNALFYSDAGTIDILRRNLNEEGKAIAQARIMQQIADNAVSKETGDISRDLFMKQFYALQPQLKAFFKGTDEEALKGVASYIQLTKQAGKIGANPMTGNKLFLPFLGGGLVSMLGPEGAVVTSAGMYAAAHAFQSKPVRDALIQLSRLNIDAPEAGYLYKRLNQVWQASANDFALKKLEDRKVNLAFNDRATRQELIGQGYVLDDSLSGYRIISKDGKSARLLGPTGQLLGVFDDVESARKRANMYFYRDAKREAQKTLKSIQNAP